MRRMGRKWHESRFTYRARSGGSCAPRRCLLIVSMTTAFSLRSLFIALFAFAAVAVPEGRAQTVSLTSQEQTLANHLISDSGQQRPFLKLDPVLMQCARWRAQDMARRGYFGDIGPDGYGPDAKLQQAGYVLPGWWGTSSTANYVESIAAGLSSADATWSDWMNSGPHKQHLLGETSFYASETSYGVGYASVPGSPYTYYWVVITAPPSPVTIVPDALTIATPSPYLLLSAPQVAIAGTASGSTTVQSVQIRIENAAGIGAYQPASGTGAWGATASGLAPGFNTLRVQSLNAAGAEIKQASVAVFYGVLTPVAVNVSGSGSVTSGFLGTTQLYIGGLYTVTATPAAGNLFSGWTGSATSANPTLSITAQPGAAYMAHFAPNPFTSRAGTYYGLIGGAQPGVFRVFVGSLGAYSATAMIGGHAYVAWGQLGADGSVNASMSLRGAAPVTLALKLDTQGASGFTGSVTVGAETESFTAAAPYQASGGGFRNAGQYTVALSPSADAAAGVPQGHGWAVLVVRPNGVSAIACVLPDGKAVVTPAFALADGSVNVYALTYGGRGSLAGKINLQPSGNSDLTGTFDWNKPADPSNKLTPAGFSTVLNATGSIYVPPTAGSLQPALAGAASPSTIVFSSGGLLQPAAQTLTGSLENLALAQPVMLPRLNFTLNAPTGIFYGAFFHPVTGALMIYQGVVFQKSNTGYGFFPGSTEGGDVEIQ